MKTAIRTGILAIVAIAVLGASEARALLIVKNIVTDTATNLKVELGWAPEGNDGLVVGGLTNWAVSVATVQTANSTMFTAILQHLVGPIAPQGGIAGNFANSSYGIVATGNDSVAHDGASDYYTLVFDRSQLAANTTITLTGAHIVPEPSTALLGLAGLGLLAGARLIRRRAH